MTWTIRPAIPEDVPLLAQVEVDAGRRFRQIGLDAIAEDQPLDHATLAAHVADGTAWVAVDETAAVVGYSLASVVDGAGHLDQVSVLERAGGRGIGRALVRVVEQWAAERRLGAVSLTTFVDVPWNGPFYRSLGYRVLADEELGPELAAIRHRERALGLDISPRAAMERPVDGSSL